MKQELGLDSRLRFGLNYGALDKPRVRVDASIDSHGMRNHKKMSDHESLVMSQYLHVHLLQGGLSTLCRIIFRYGKARARCQAVNNGSRPSTDNRITYRGYGPRLTGLVQYEHSVTGAKHCANTINTRI